MLGYLIQSITMDRTLVDDLSGVLSEQYFKSNAMVEIGQFSWPHFDDFLPAAGFVSNRQRSSRAN